jgi:RNA polymerase sigma-70 factor (ECF subfamily)
LCNFVQWYEKEIPEASRYISETGTAVEFYSFNRAYLERLAAGDPETEQHFSEYFSELILIKLRARQFTWNIIEDVRQETFLRVLQAIRRQGIREPERIGPFVNSVCKHVVQEFGRSGARLTFMDDGAPELPDDRVDSERELVTRERAAEVRVVLSKMSTKNRKLLSAVFLEERPNEEICRQFNVDQNYLRVLLFRARAQFRQTMDKRRTVVARKAG